MKKLSKAQEKLLETIKDVYKCQAYDSSYFEECVAKETKDDLKKIWQSYVDMQKNGFILITSPNSRTLEVLARFGYIEYVKQERWGAGCSCIDWVKLL